MTELELRIIARVLAKHRFSQVRSDIGGTVAWVTCDLSDAFRAEITDFDYLGFWNEIARAQREVQLDPTRL